MRYGLCLPNGGACADARTLAELQQVGSLLPPWPAEGESPQPELALNVAKGAPGRCLPSREISNRPRDFQDTMEGSRTQLELLHGCAHE